MGCCVLPYCLFHYFFLLLVLVVHFPSFTCSTTLPLCNPHDSSALLQFKNSVSVNPSTPHNWWFQRCPSFPSKTASWENGTNCCRWDGVTCDAMSGHVIGLDLSCNHLQGKLNPNTTLFHLTHLQHLNLAFNYFSASLLSPAIGGLVSLTHLNLSYSSFVGDIPTTISHLSKLVSLDLSFLMMMRLDASTWNRLILNATNLEELVLNGVDMSSIREDSLSLLTNLSSSLVSLEMSDNGLKGNFPRDILCLPNIQHLNLLGNPMLTGELPKSNWTAPLRLLDLSQTSFSGIIPNSIGHLKFLEVLWLANCQFERLLPPSFWNLTQLTDLDLSQNNLSGEIPSLLSTLKHLKYLYLYSNNFSGQIPTSLYNLTQLSSIHLSFNHLEGPIPSTFGSASILTGTIPRWCYSLPSLLVLFLNDNKLTGSIDEFSSYSLSLLELSNNNFQGRFPKSIFEFENLTILGLSSTNLNDLVDFHEFSRLKKLENLDLSHNNFLSFNIDDNFDNILPNLEILDLSSCNITKFPPFIARLQNLGFLDLSNNKIHGKIPRWLFNDSLLFLWKNIEVVDLSFNQLQGDIPIPPYGTLFFSVSNNNLSGAISSTLCNASSLQMLILSHNNLTGMIPQCLGSFRSLQVLDLQRNNLYGSIPGNFSESNVFQTIKLNANRLEGPLPQSLAHCTNLEVLDLGDNYIQDLFPGWLETLPKLKVLVLRANLFHGIITSINTKHPFPQLRIFDVSNNKFSGPLPTTYFQNFQEMMTVNHSQSGLKYIDNITYRAQSYNDSVVVTMKGRLIELQRILSIFATIDLSNNKFEGEIPQVIGELKSLKGLNLSHNAIRGTIPESLGNLENLEWLDISRNQLEGEIPMALTNLNFLSFLNLSQNQLQGTIPAGKQFNTFQNDSYLGNPMLCGFPLSNSCNHDERKPPSTSVHEERLEFGWKPVVVGYACGVVFGMLLGYCFFLTGKPLWLARLTGLPNKRAKRRTNNRARANR